MFTKTFKELGLSDITHKIFIDLIEKGPSTARQIAERLAIPRSSVYDYIKLLIQKGLVFERDEENKKVFQVDEIKNLPQLVEQKIQLLEKEKQNIEKLIPTLLEQTRFTEPKIKFYSGTEGIKQVFNQILWQENIDTITMWPISEMIDVLGKDYLINLNKRRLKNNIAIRGIWPKDKLVNLKDYPFLGVGGKFLRELRSAPKGLTWNMGYWLYEDKVAFISSKKEAFGFTIQSKDLTDLLRAQFEAIWKISTPINPQAKYTDSFLENVGII